MLMIKDVGAWQERRSILLSEGAGDEWRALLSVAVEGVRGGDMQNFMSTPLDCKKAPLLNINTHFISGRIGYQLYDIIKEQKNLRGACMGMKRADNLLLLLLLLLFNSY